MPINNEIIKILSNKPDKYKASKPIHVKLIEAQITQKLFLTLFFFSIMLFTPKNMKNNIIIANMIKFISAIIETSSKRLMHLVLELRK